MTASLYSVPAETLSEFVFHSNWIEGYPPDENDTNSSLYREHLSTAQYVVETGDWDPQRLHVRLFGGTGLGHLQPQYVGIFRNSQVYIGSFLPPSPGRHLLAHIERWKAMVLDGPDSWADAEAWAWRVHHEYECIHPFVDGNGRTGRLILNALRLKYNLPWFIVHHGDEQQAYYGQIRTYQRSGAWRCSQWHPDKGYEALFSEGEELATE